MTSMTSHNSFPDLCELAVSFEADTENPTQLLCNVVLRISCGEVPLGDQECSISFKRLTISVDKEGIDISNKSRFGEPLKANTVQKKISVTQTENKTRERSWAFLGTTKSTPEGSVKYSQITSDGMSKDTSLQEEDKHHRVTARPNLRWEVKEADDEQLDGTYMDGQTLFAATTNQGANRQTVSLALKVRQRVLSINHIYRNDSALSFFSSLSENQRRLIDIFIAKSLSNATYGDRKYVGEITLSEFEYVHED